MYVTMAACFANFDFFVMMRGNYMIDYLQSELWSTGTLSPSFCSLTDTDCVSTCDVKMFNLLC